MKELEKLGFQGVHPFFWIKSGVPVKETIPQTVNVETAIFAWSKSTTLSPNNPSSYMLWKPEEKRYASIELPIVSHHFTFEKKTNPAEKPPQLMEKICSRYCPPGGTVLIIGPGFGGDLEGALRAGCNVVAVEKNKFQYKAVCTRVSKLIFQQMQLEVKAAAPPPTPGPPKQTGRAAAAAQRQKTITELFQAAQKEHPRERLRKLALKPDEQISCSGCGRAVPGKPLFCYICTTGFHGAEVVKDKPCFFKCEYCSLIGVETCTFPCHEQLMSLLPHPRMKRITDKFGRYALMNSLPTDTDLY